MWVWAERVKWGESEREEKKSERTENEGKRWSSTLPLTPVPVCTSWMGCRGAWCSPATGSWTGSWPPVWPLPWRSANDPKTPAPSSPCVSWLLHPFICCSSSHPCPLLCWASSFGLPCRLFASHTCTHIEGECWFSNFFFTIKEKCCLRVNMIALWKNLFGFVLFFVQSWQHLSSKLWQHKGTILFCYF